MSFKPKAIEVNTPYTHEKRQSQVAPHALIPKKNEKENEENEPKCPYASKSQWFLNHPEACRLCSGDGTNMVGGYRADLEDATRVTCSHCNGTRNDPCYLVANPQKSEKVDEFGPFYSDEMKYMSEEDMKALRDRYTFTKKYLDGEWITIRKEHEPGFNLIPDNEVKK